MPLVADYRNNFNTPVVCFIAIWPLFIDKDVSPILFNRNQILFLKETQLTNGCITFIRVFANSAILLFQFAISSSAWHKLAVEFSFYFLFWKLESAEGK